MPDLGGIKGHAKSSTRDLQALTNFTQSQRRGELFPSQEVTVFTQGPKRDLLFSLNSV